VTESIPVPDRENRHSLDGREEKEKNDFENDFETG
jgi:hypothetical protein